MTFKEAKENIVKLKIETEKNKPSDETLINNLRNYDQFKYSLTSEGKIEFARFISEIMFDNEWWKIVWPSDFSKALWIPVILNELSLEMVH